MLVSKLIAKVAGGVMAAEKEGNAVDAVVGISVKVMSDTVDVAFVPDDILVIVV